jgi:hypothetical protein
MALSTLTSWSAVHPFSLAVLMASVFGHCPPHPGAATMRADRVPISDAATHPSTHSPSMQRRTLTSVLFGVHGESAMNRRLWLVLSGGGVVALTAAAWLCWPRSTTCPEPVGVHFSDLPKQVYRRGDYKGQAVRVAFYRSLTPTDDPLVWHFHPGEPAAVVPPTYRLHFAEPPTAGPLIVVGTVEGIDPDGVRRVSGVPGVVVLRGCRALPDAP